MKREQLSPLRRSAATLLAAAVLDIFPDVLLVGGGDSDIGFYYDFIFTQTPLETASELIELKMRSLAKEGLEIRSFSMMRENAEQFFLHHGQPVLASHALEDDTNVISLVQVGSCYDLSAPPHAATTEELKAFKLLEREHYHENNNSIIRFIGTVFPDNQSLKVFSKAFDRYKKMGYQNLGTELNLYSWDEEARCYWHPNGELLRQQLLKSWHQENSKTESLPITTPISSQSIFYEHVRLYKTKLSNTVELPARFTEVRTVEDEKSEGGASLFQLKSYTTDQVTTFCSNEQLLQELISSLQFIEQTIRIFDLKVHRYLVANEPNRWLVQALQQCGISFTEEKPTSDNEGSTLEWRIEDVLGREWAGSSVQLMKLSADRYALGRTLYSSLDRFVGLLVERYEGQLPLWLAPEQVRVLAVGLKCADYADTVYRECRDHKLRVQRDNRDMKLGAKIHEADIERIPYVIIIGDKEKNQNSVTVRSLERKHEMKTESLEDFFCNILKGDQ